MYSTNCNWLKTFCPNKPAPYMEPPSSPQLKLKKVDCSRILHDYIKCIHDDETCCADIYQKYIECKNINTPIS